MEKVRGVLSVTSKLTAPTVNPVTLTKSKKTVVTPPDCVKLPVKFGSFREWSSIEQQPPPSLATGSTESAMAMEDERPSRIRLKNQREIFMNRPLVTTPIAGQNM